MAQDDEVRGVPTRPPRGTKGIGPDDEDPTHWSPVPFVFLFVVFVIVVIFGTLWFFSIP